MSKKVLVYSTTACPFCHMVKDYLKEKNVEFTDYNVGEDGEKAEEMTKKSGQVGVPVLDVEGEIIVGFDREKINSVLGLN